MNTRAGAHMRDSDAFSWYMEHDPLLRSTIVGVLVLDRSPDWERLTDRLERATRLSPGFRHRIVVPPLRLATPRWVVDPDFDLSWHVRRFEASPPKTLAGVMDFARKTGMAGFDRDRPLWELTFVEGLEGGRTALVMKLHHALTDGIGGMQMAGNLFDFEPDPPDLGPMPDAPPGQQLGTAALLRDAVGYNSWRLYDFARHHVGSVARDAAHALRHPGETLGGAWDTLASIGRTIQPVSETMSPVMTERHLNRHYDVLQFPLDDMRRATRAAGVSLNDAFLAAIATGLRAYHHRRGAHVHELRVTMPISIRKPDDPVGGNRITLMRFKVPIDIVDPVKRMGEIHRRCGAVRAERSLPLTNAIAAALNLVPSRYIGGMLKHVDFIASNVPGITVPLYLAGAEVTGFYAFAPTIGAALNVTLISYCGTCFVGVNMDTGAVSDSGLMLESLREGFTEVLDLAGGNGRVTLPAVTR